MKESSPEEILKKFSRNMARRLHQVREHNRSRSAKWSFFRVFMK